MSLPRTLGELQLYRVLQRANLLMYYDTFIQQGGDDVQQLCEAGEEEFLEIMALVGMATKPLHVRRLQKALRDWAANPTLFNQPLATNVAPCGVPLLRINSTSPAGSGVIGGRKSLSNGQPSSPCEREEVGSCLTPLRDNSPKSPCSQASPVPSDHLYREKLSPMDPHWLTPEMYGAAELDEEQPITHLPFACHSRLLGPPTPTSSSSSSTMTSPWPGGQLDPETVKAVEESVDRLLRTMPQADQTEVKTLLRLNKKMAKTVGHIFNLEAQDQSKEEEIRKYSLIYGRFDSKRREGKQLTHHEITDSDRLSKDPVANSDNRSTADDNSLSGESLDSITPDISPQLHPSSSPHPLTDTTGLINWSRQLMQQTLMDEGLRLARMVSRDHASKVSLGSEKRQISEMEEKVSERRGSSNRSHSPANTKDDPQLTICKSPC
ncbi:NGFI-A-binding protein 2-like isoform X3 [Carassius gibelio]|uniref:NGFI-A-binding protein 2-like isoform X3 n=1 Tax=Carassius gibelio TaxID=101364 RepID=UPI0022794BD2|nr:NGFI-A-binding protein 2-like isoform X3 [Carassius gibelio]